MWEYHLTIGDEIVEDEMSYISFYYDGAERDVPLRFPITERQAGELNALGFIDRVEGALASYAELSVNLSDEVYHALSDFMGALLEAGEE